MATKTTTNPATVDAEVECLMREEMQREDAQRLERIRQKVLADREAEEAAQARAAQIAALRERIPRALDPAVLKEARATLAAAIDAYMATCAAYDAQHSDLWNDLSNLAGGSPLPADLAAQHTYGGMISADGVDYRRSRLQVTLERIARETFRRYYPRDGFDLGKPQD